MELEEREKAEKKKRGPKSASVINLILLEESHLFIDADIAVQSHFHSSADYKLFFDTF